MNGDSSNHLTGRVAIVTGAGSDAGSKIATELARSGCLICVVDQNPDRADRSAEHIVASGGEAFSWQADISNKFQAASMIETTRDRYGRLDIMVNAAYVKPHTDVLKMDEWSVRRVSEVNLTGAFFCAQLAARVMSDEGGGLIFLLYQPPNSIDLSSTTALYASTQGAVLALADAMNQETPDSVIVSAVVRENSGLALENILMSLREHLPPLRTNST